MHVNDCNERTCRCMFSAAIPRVRERLIRISCTLKSLGGHGRCCPCQQPLLGLTRASWLTYWAWVAMYSSYPFPRWWNWAPHFPRNPSIIRWLSQLVYDTGYAPHARSKLQFLVFNFTRKQINKVTINSQCSAEPISSVYHNKNPILPLPGQPPWNPLPTPNDLQLSAPPSRPPRFWQVLWGGEDFIQNC